MTSAMHPTLPILLMLALQPGAAAQGFQFVDGPSLSNRALVFDAARQRLVTFGIDGAAWEFDTRWRRHPSSTRRWRRHHREVPV